MEVKVLLKNCRSPWLALLIVFAAGACGCASLTEKKLKTVSAGYTGCRPEENELSNVVAKPDGSGTWNATCKGKTYLCSAISTLDNSAFHCSPVAQ